MLYDALPLMAEQTTLILLKPDCVSKHLCGEVLKRFEGAGFRIRGLKMIQLDDAILKDHYSHIADKPFFPDVAKFMKETGISIAVVTDSALIRGVARAVGFLGVQVRAFAPAEMPSALNYLVVPQARHDAMIRRIDALKAQLAHARGGAAQKGA